MELKIYCDGGARGNPGPAAAAFIVTDSTGKILHQHGEFIGITTNNIAEYRAVLLALEWLNQKIKIDNWNSKNPAGQLKIVNFYLDSALVVNQLNGLFKVKKAHLRQLIVQIKFMEVQLSSPITYTAVPRSQNSPADALVNQVLDSSPPGIL